MYMIYFIIILIQVLTRQISSTVVIPNVNPSNCEDKQYFQYSSLRCLPCGVDQQKSPDSLSCACEKGSRIITDYGGPNKVCLHCGDEEVVSSDGWSCVKCEVDGDFIFATRTCRPCDADSVSVDREQNGRTSTRKACVKCISQTTPRTGEGVCTRCHPQVLKATGGASCSCSTAPGEYAVFREITLGACVQSIRN